MKIETAIETLVSLLETPDYERDPDDEEAIKCGIEALRFALNLRHVTYPATLFKPPVFTLEDQDECLHS